MDRKIQGWARFEKDLMVGHYRRFSGFPPQGPVEMSLFQVHDLVQRIGRRILALRSIIAQVNQKSSFLNFRELHDSCQTGCR